MARRNPEALLMQARAAESPAQRAKYATGGLSQPRLASETQALLLRQLYLAHLESERYEDAKKIAEQMLELGLLGDVALHDASRACLALGDATSAVRYLRTATRSGPASRRAFHLSCLGSLYLHLGQFAEAARVLRRAVRWATEEKPLYRAQLALALKALGEPVDLAEAFSVLEALRRRSGYAEYVLGELALALGKRSYAKNALQTFVSTAEAASISVRAGLRCELLRAKDLLAQLSELSP